MTKTWSERMAVETLAEVLVRRAYEQYLRQPEDQEEGTCQKT